MSKPGNLVGIELCLGPSIATRSGGWFRLLGSLLWLAPAGVAWAQSPQEAATLPPVTVTGYAEPVPKSELSNDPAANPASVTTLKLPDEMKRGTRDYVDLLKPIVGVAANNFDQGGIGFGFTMRGFSERSNGGGVAYSIDGVPVNLPSHALTNGYGDLTPLIPELLDQLILTRGPFDVRFGANSLGGSVQFVTQDNPVRGAALSAGNFDFVRGFGALPLKLGSASGYVSLLGSKTSGYRDNADLRQINTFNKFSFALPGGTGSVRLQLFADRFGAPGFLRRDLVENGTLDPRTAINRTDGGNTDLQVLAFNYKQDGDEPIKANAYVMNSALDRYSNRASTVPISLDLPGQVLQKDDRLTFGATLEKYFRWLKADATGFDLFIGTGLRRDVVKSRVFNTVRRVEGTQAEDTDFTLTNPYAYAQGSYKPLSWLKVVGGYRYDRLQFSIEDRTRKSNVAPTVGVAQPKAGVVVSPLTGLSLFANYGKSFLPPSATGGQLSRNPDLGAPELATKEIGVQWTSPDGVFAVRADVYRTTFTNEILNQNPPLLPIYLGPSRRDGFDLELRARVYRERERTAALFINYSKVDGELVNRTTGTSIPDVAKFFVKYGVDVALPLGGIDPTRALTFSASQIWEGPRPLNTTNTLQTKTFSRIDAKLTYSDRRWNGFSAFLGVIAYPDRVLEETAFTFGTPVAVGVSPKARVTAQAGVFIPF